jgi:hypothetical protein
MNRIKGFSGKHGAKKAITLYEVLVELGKVSTVYSQCLFGQLESWCLA